MAEPDESKMSSNHQGATHHKPSLGCQPIDVAMEIKTAQRLAPKGYRAIIVNGEMTFDAN